MKRINNYLPFEESDKKRTKNQDPIQIFKREKLEVFEGFQKIKGVPT